VTIEIPPRKRPEHDDGYFEQITKAIFRSGFSWRVVRDKWPNFQQAWDSFDIEQVASYDERDLDRLLADSGIVRNGRKIEATIHNARVIRDLVIQYGSFHAYLRSLDELNYPARRKALGKQFHHLGPTGVFVFLYSVDEDVPSWEDRHR
jgi:3-methyladenine DNA glycosylase Tag